MKSSVSASEGLYKLMHVKFGSRLNVNVKANIRIGVPKMLEMRER